MATLPKSPPFGIQTYFVYNLALHAWLSREAKWTQSLDEACPFTNEDAAYWTQTPPGTEFDDLFIMASDAIFEEMREDTIGPTLQDPAWYKPVQRA